MKLAQFSIFYKAAFEKSKVSLSFETLRNVYFEDFLSKFQPYLRWRLALVSFVLETTTTSSRDMTWRDRPSSTVENTDFTTDEWQTLP